MGIVGDSGEGFNEVVKKIKLKIILYQFKITLPPPHYPPIKLPANKRKSINATAGKTADK